MTNKARIIAHNNLIDRAINKANSLPNAENFNNPIAASNEVNFYDYDGTIRYSYTVEDAQALAELPPLPKHKGLICQGWVYDLDTIKACNRPVNIGATYITDDGKTRLYIKITSEDRIKVPITLMFGTGGILDVIIDWGDGSAAEAVYDDSGWFDVVVFHTYNSIGNYTITIKPMAPFSLGSDFSSNFINCVIGDSYYSLPRQEFVYRNMLQKVEIGDLCEFPGNAFAECPSLTNIIIPTNNRLIWQNTFLRCTGLTNVTIPNTIKAIYDNAFEGCSSLTYISIPSSVGEIDNRAFANCYGMVAYDFSAHTSIPTLNNTNAFEGIPSDCKIRVPASLYNEWVAATNWSVYADYIVAV